MCLKGRVARRGGKQRKRGRRRCEFKYLFMQEQGMHVKLLFVCCRKAFRDDTIHTCSGNIS
jgi:hypothetical protein